MKLWSELCRARRLSGAVWLGNLLVSALWGGYAVAATPIFSLTPLQSAPAKIVQGREAQAQYQVTNNTRVALNGSGVVDMAAGVTQDTSGGACGTLFDLAPKASCILKLTIHPTQTGTIQMGPTVCNTPSHPAFCSQPTSAQRMVVQVVSSDAGLLQLGVPVNLTLTPGASSALTVKNLSSTETADNIQAKLPANLASQMDSVDDSSCAAVAAGQTCQIVFHAKASATPLASPATVQIYGANTQTATVPAQIGAGGAVLISLNDDPANLHAQYRRIDVENETSGPVTYNGSGMSLALMDKIHVCGTEDAQCAAVFQSTCNAAVPLGKGDSCYIWVKSVDDSQASGTTTGTLTVNTSAGGKQFALNYHMDLIAGGNFESAGGNDAEYIARWDGTHWSALGTGTNAQVFALSAYHGDLIAGGAFTTAGGDNANRIARWNGQNWSALGQGNSADVRALVVYDNDLIVGGAFTTAGGIAVNRIARWDGQAWHALGMGMNNNVFALTVYNGALIAGGAFTTAGDHNANRIASWNGESWTAAFGNLITNTVFTVSVYNSDLIAGGAFAVWPDANRIARWDGANWQTLGGGMTAVTPPSVNALTVYGEDLIAGGQFTSAGGNAANNIARWNGANWAAVTGSVVSPGMNDVVNALTVYQGELVAGGLFTQADGQNVNYIARWNGANWSALGAGMAGDENAQVYSLLSFSSLALSEP